MHFHSLSHLRTAEVSALVGGLSLSSHCWENRQDHNPLLGDLAVMPGAEWITQTEPVKIMFGSLKQAEKPSPISQPGHRDTTTRI